MPVKRWRFVLVVTAIVASAAWPLAATARLSVDAVGGDSITLTGCLVRGDGDAGGYLLTNGSSEPAWQKADASVAPGAVGTTGTVAAVFYWLHDDEDLREHVGQRVEIKGALEDRIEDGEIRVERKKQWTEIEITTDDGALKARVPWMSVVPVGDGDHKAAVLVRRVDVERLRMLSASCQP